MKERKKRNGRKKRQNKGDIDMQKEREGMKERKKRNGRKKRIEKKGEVGKQKERENIESEKHQKEKELEGNVKERYKDI